MNSLGSSVTSKGELNTKPLLLELKVPYLIKLRVYLYNCTSPAGGRPSHEYKCQIIVPGQTRGHRGNFDFSDGYFVLLCAYGQLSDHSEEGVFVFWDATHHMNFAYSANIQVRVETMIAALFETVGIGTRKNNEVVITAKPANLLHAIIKRIETVNPNT